MKSRVKDSLKGIQIIKVHNLVEREKAIEYLMIRIKKKRRNRIWKRGNNKEKSGNRKLSSIRNLLIREKAGLKKHKRRLLVSYKIKEYRKIKRITDLLTIMNQTIMVHKRKEEVSMIVIN